MQTTRQLKDLSISGFVFRFSLSNIGGLGFVIKNSKVTVCQFYLI